jgi:hypothetical protein
MRQAVAIAAAGRELHAGSIGIFNDTLDSATLLSLATSGIKIGCHNCNDNGEACCIKRRRRITERQLRKL